MPSNTVLISGPAVGAAQILICFMPLCSCLQCPQLSELVRLLLWELSINFYIFHRHRVCLVEHVDFTCSCTAHGNVLGPLPQPHCPWVSLVVLSPPLHVGHPLGFAPEAALEDLGLPL